MAVSTRLAATTAALALALPSLATAGTPAADAPASKSPSAALALATTGTLVGLAAGSAGATLVANAGPAHVQGIGIGLVGLASAGPALGHFYAGEIEHAVVTSGLRAGGVAALVIGVEKAITFDCDPEEEEEMCPDRESYAALALVGAGVILGTTIYDLVDAPRAVRRANAHALVLVPAALPAKDGPAPGLSLSGRF